MPEIPEIQDTPPGGDVCEWFALCVRPANTYRLHPILGAVPICKECDEKVAHLGNEK
ncbi:hypothetical protein Mbo2_084 [Rhodococcus phage Mbo2]|uniref:Uncharacterized protein n=1 Tax=Rhodococcus phage Mbo2 TaxID=2936911 RepID=A0A9E7LH63_9CAUD|nr:hypothetical protein Mbo2_084 [Rhodococcus phage Mbo2]